MEPSAHKPITKASAAWLVVTVIGVICCLLCLTALLLSVFLIFQVEKEHFHKTKCYVLDCLVVQTSTCQSARNEIGTGRVGDPVEKPEEPVAVSKRHKQEQRFTAAYATAARNNNNNNGGSGCASHYRLNLDLALVLKGTCGQIRGGKISTNLTLNNLDTAFISKLFDDVHTAQSSSETYNSIHNGQLPQQIQATAFNGTTFCIHQSGLSERMYSSDANFCPEHPVTTRCYYDDRKKRAVRIDEGSPFAGGISSMVVFSFFTLVCCIAAICCAFLAVVGKYEN